MFTPRGLQLNMQIDNKLALISIPIVFILSFTGSFFPPFIDRIKPEWNVLETKTFCFLTGLAGGVLICVGYVHSFNDASVSFAILIENGYMPNYAWAGLFALAGTLCTVFLEVAFKHVYTLVQKRKEAIINIQSSKGNLHENTKEDERKKELSMFFLEMLILLCGLSFHSFFVGLALGLTKDDISLFIAIIAHQLLEALALGEKVAKSKLKSKAIVLIDVLFSLSTPIGIIAGTTMLHFLYNEYVYYFIDGVANAFSAGILIFVAIDHLLLEEYEKNEGKTAKLLLLTFGILTGATFMAIIGIWA